MVLYLFISTTVKNLKPSTHHLPRLALLFAGGVIFVYLIYENKVVVVVVVVVVQPNPLGLNPSNRKLNLISVTNIRRFKRMAFSHSKFGLHSSSFISSKSKRLLS